MGAKVTALLPHELRPGHKIVIENNKLTVTGTRQDKSTWYISVAETGLEYAWPAETPVSLQRGETQPEDEWPPRPPWPEECTAWDLAKGDNVLREGKVWKVERSGPAHEGGFYVELEREGTARRVVYDRSTSKVQRTHAEPRQPEPPTSPRFDIKEMLGHVITVTGPHGSWTGKLNALAQDPSMLVDVGWSKVMLPQSFLVERGEREKGLEEAGFPMPPAEPRPAIPPLPTAAQIQATKQQVSDRFVLETIRRLMDLRATGRFGSQQVMDTIEALVASVELP